MDYTNNHENRDENKNTLNSQNQQGAWQYPGYQAAKSGAEQSQTQNPQSQTAWQGSNYHYSYQNPQPNAVPPVYQTPNNPKPPKKKAGKGKKIFLKCVAGAMACLMISVGSIAGFTALVNNGVIQLGSSSSTDPAFQITKLVKTNDASDTSATGELSKQEIAAKVVPSVVCIQNYQISNTTGNYSYGDRGGENAQGTAATSEDDSAVSPSSEGSGIIASSDGYIITNAHVIEGATSLKVILSDGKTYSAEVVGSDSVTDLALIKINATGLTAAEFGNSDDLEVAEAVMAIGNPGGLTSSVTIGYVSALNREITTENGNTMKCIQTDAAINPGNSGGALVNMYGQVIGINSNKIAATGYEGLGFAIPINSAQEIISQLKEYGYVKDRAVLGVTGQYIDSMTSRFYNLPTGFYINAITNEALTSVGIQKGDVITAIDGKDVTSQNVITSVVNSKKPGDTVELTVTSGTTGKSFTATVKLAQSTGQ